MLSTTPTYSRACTVSSCCSPRVPLSTSSTIAWPVYLTYSTCLAQGEPPRSSFYRATRLPLVQGKRCLVFSQVICCLPIYLFTLQKDRSTHFGWIVCVCLFCNKRIGNGVEKFKLVNVNTVVWTKSNCVVQMLSCKGLNLRVGILRNGKDKTFQEILWTKLCCTDSIIDSF